MVLVREMTGSDEKEDSAPLPFQGMCGIIRPIAGGSDYSASHWRDVHDIVADAASSVGYQPRLVSESDAAGVILSEIITNIYNDPIIICDVSSKNPNVMFELGLRMAFEKPVIIIADDETDFSFDISPVKHLKYPRSLRFGEIITFKSSLASAMKATVEQASSADYRGYLQQFGPIHVTNLETQNIAIDSLGQQLVEIKRAVQSISGAVTAPRSSSHRSNRLIGDLVTKMILDAPESMVRDYEGQVDSLSGYYSEISKRRDGKFDFRIYHYDEPIDDADESRRRLANLIDTLNGVATRKDSVTR